MRALLLNRGRPGVYSTALPVPVAVAARTAIQVAARESWRRAHVWRLTRLVSRALGVPAASPIIPLVVGGEADALALSRALLLAGYHVPAIRPPTVAPGTCRLRLSLSAAHSEAQVRALVGALQAALAAMPHVRLQRLPHLEGGSGGSGAAAAGDELGVLSGSGRQGQGQEQEQEREHEQQRQQQVLVMAAANAKQPRARL
jgi:8-amino-7-oxononanoate synthase